MDFSFDNLNGQLKSDNTDILELALGQLSRLPATILLNSRTRQQEALELATRLQEHSNADVRLLAEQAIKHIEDILLARTRQEEQKQLENNKTMEISADNASAEEIDGTEETSVKKPELCFRPEMLFSKQPDQRKVAIDAGLAQKPPDLYRHIVTMIATESDDEVLALAIDALAQIGQETAVTLLHVFLYYENELIRAKATEAIEKIGRKEDILELLPPLLKDNNEQVKESALRAIARFSTKEIVTHLKTMISSEDYSIRTSCLFVLSHIKGKSIIPLLSIAANDPNIENRLKLLEILKEQNNTEVIPILRRLAEDTEFEVSEKALEILTEIENGTNTDESAEDKSCIENDEKIEENDGLLDIEAILKKNKERKIQEKKQREAEKAAEELARAQRDTEEVDNAIEEQMLIIGREVYKMHEMGIIKEECFLTQIYTIQKLQEQLREKQKDQTKGFLKTLRKAFGKIAEQQKIVELECKIEDSLINLGETVYEITTKQVLEIPEFEENIKEINQLLAKRI